MPTLDEHELRYSPLAGEIEKILMRRFFERRLDGYTLETSLEIAQLAFDFHADPFLQR